MNLIDPERGKPTHALIDAIETDSVIVGGIVVLRGNEPVECFVNDVVPPASWIWPDDAARSRALLDLFRSLLGALDAEPLLLVISREHSETASRLGLYLPSVSWDDQKLEWVGVPPFSGHPASELVGWLREADSLAAWFGRLRQGILLESQNRVNT